MSKYRLERVKAYSTIFATIAVPLIVAFFGWRVEIALSGSEEKRAFIQLAVETLSDPNQTEELREWATLLLSDASPVPFEPSLKYGLEMGSVSFRRPIPYELLNSPLMEPPTPWKEIEKEGQLTNRDLLENYLDNKLIAGKNAITLEHLQKLIRHMADPQPTQPPEAGPQG